MRRLATRLATLLAAVAVVVGAALMIPGCGDSPQVSSGPASGELPDQEVSDFVATETDQGEVQWKMYARSAATYRARNTVVARGVRIDFFDEKGQRSSTLTADTGEMNDLTHDMMARGNVVMQATEGTRMTTDLLHFLNKQQRIVTDSFVRVDRRGDVLTGYGFESDPDLKNFQFKRQVRATVHTNSGGTIESAPRSTPSSRRGAAR
jgi:LPS export ABC transporter protein LptC